MKIVIIGSGLSGSTISYLLKNKYDIELYECRNHIGGNCYSYYDNDIEIHKYGPHIFNTNNNKVWNFISKFDDFNHFKLNTITKTKKGDFFLPLNLSIFNTIYHKNLNCNNINSFLNSITIKCDKPINVEQKAKSIVGTKIFNIFIKPYIEKQWLKKCNQIPQSFFNKCPFRPNYNIDYFNTKYQGIPIHGYTNIFKKMLKDINIIHKKWCIKNYNKNNLYFYTGSIDELFNYKYGKLEWRSVYFKFLKYKKQSILGNSCIVYPDKNIDYIRQTEMKYFHPENEKSLNKNYTIICREFTKGNNKYYPLPNEKNLNLYNKYLNILKKQYPNIIPCGRLGSYKYYNMDQCINECMKLCQSL